MLVISSLIYAFLETILSLLVSGAISIAKMILDESVTIFTAETNIFDKFVSLIPFSNSGLLVAVIEGIAYAIIIVSLIIGLMQSIATPISSGKNENPAQVLIRCVLTFLLINLLFGFDFGSTSTLKFNGLIGVIGQWFGTVLSFIPEPNVGFFDNLSFDVKLNPAEYVGALVLYATLLASVVGAALTYIERVISFAVYIIFGPIAVSLNAYRDTSETFKTWILGVFTQFMAILISLVFWYSFLLAADRALTFGIAWLGGNQLFNLAVAIAILTIVKNSEKILNAYGLKTMANRDSAAALIGGIGALGTGMMMTMRLTRSFGGKSYNSAGGGAALEGGGSYYNSAGDMMGNVSLRNAQGKFTLGSIAKGISESVSNVVQQNGGVWGTITASNPLSSGIKGAGATGQKRRNAVDQLVNNVKDGNQTISGGEINSAFGFNNRTSLMALDEGKYTATTITTESGATVSGVVGDFRYTHGGKTETLKDAFLVTNGANHRLNPGTAIGENGRMIDSTASGPTIDGQGNQIYRTVKDPPPMTVGSFQVGENGNERYAKIDEILGSMNSDYSSAAVDTQKPEVVTSTIYGQENMNTYDFNDSANPADSFTDSSSYTASADISSKTVSQPQHNANVSAKDSVMHSSTYSKDVTGENNNIKSSAISGGNNGADLLNTMQGNRKDKRNGKSQ